MVNLCLNFSFLFSSVLVSCPGPNEGWKIIDVSVRETRAHEVFLKVYSSGICGSDHFVQDGSWPGIQYPRIPGHEVIGRVVATGPAVDQDRLRPGSLVGVGWNGGYCHTCGPCMKGDFAGCNASQYSGFSHDGGHGEYAYAPETGTYPPRISIIIIILIMFLLLLAVVSIPEDALKKASYAELAPLMCAGTTVYGAIRTSKWDPGDICIVQGIGGLGHLAIQVSRTTLFLDLI